MAGEIPKVGGVLGALGAIVVPIVVAMMVSNTGPFRDDPPGSEVSGYESELPTAESSAQDNADLPADDVAADATDAAADATASAAATDVPSAGESSNASMGGRIWVSNDCSDELYLELSYNVDGNWIDLTQPLVIPASEGKLVRVNGEAIYPTDGQIRYKGQSGEFTNMTLGTDSGGDYAMYFCHNT